jgi:hypothetical protein
LSYVACFGLGRPAACPKERGVSQSAPVHDHCKDADTNEHQRSGWNQVVERANGLVELDVSRFGSEQHWTSPSSLEKSWRFTDRQEPTRSGRDKIQRSIIFNSSTDLYAT